jgi:hypothetical protein
MINIFAKIVPADPCCLSGQLSQPTRSAYFKYLSDLNLSVDSSLRQLFTINVLFHCICSLDFKKMGVQKYLIRDLNNYSLCRVKIKDC